MTSHRFVAPIVAGFLVILSGGNAAAQNIAASGQPYPNRIVNGQNLGYSTRPENLTPLGISGQDCMEDMTLQFSVTLTGFTGADTVEVWGSTGSDCVASTDRGIGATSSVCWGLRSGNVVDPIIDTPQTYTFNVRVQDLVGWQQTPPGVAESANPPANGKAACSAQPSFAAVPMYINFLAVDSAGNSDGTPYQYSIMTDLVGPPAPAGLKVSSSGADWLTSWMPNTDKDTVGYDLFFAAASTPDGQATSCTAPPLTNPLGISVSDSGPGTSMTVSDASVGSFDLGAAQSDTQAAVALTAVDALGNLGPAASPACDAVGSVDEASAGGDQAPGVACAVAAPGEPGSAAIPALGLLAIAWGMTRRSRRRAA